MRKSKSNAVAHQDTIDPATIQRREPAGKAGAGAFGRALGIGVVAGLRTATAPAALSRAYRRGELPLATSGVLGLLTRPRIARVLPINAIGEILVDKLPWVPSRVQPAALVPRLLSGVATGSALYRGGDRPAWRGALLGALGAWLGSFAGNRGRGYAAKATGQPDFIFALAEDAIAIGGAWLVLRRPVLGVALAVAAGAVVLRVRPANTGESAEIDQH